MSLMDWSDKLDIGVEDMNDEHKGLLDLMNAIYDMTQHCDGQYDFDKAFSILTELKDKTVEHFAHEEEFMATIDYKDLGVHKGIHKQLLQKFADHYSDIKETREFPENFFQFLKFWLSAHIQGIDMKYGAAANKKSA